MSHTTVDDLTTLAVRGEQVGRLLATDGVAQALTVVRARLYHETMEGASLAIREEARAEARALNRLLDALQAIQQDGVVARHHLNALNPPTTDEENG